MLSCSLKSADNHKLRINVRAIRKLGNGEVCGGFGLDGFGGGPLDPGQLRFAPGHHARAQRNLPLRALERIKPAHSLVDKPSGHGQEDATNRVALLGRRNDHAPVLAQEGAVAGHTCHAGVGRPDEQRGGPRLPAGPGALT